MTCNVCADKKRVQVKPMPFHLKGTTYHFDCPKCTGEELAVVKAQLRQANEWLQQIEDIRL